MKVPRAIALPFIGLVAYTSCSAPIGKYHSEPEPCPSPSEAAKVLNVDVGLIEYLPDCYKATIGTASLLKTLAGVSAGRIKVRKTKDGYFLIGEYNGLDEECNSALRKLIRAADKDGDKVITPEEAKKVKQNIINYHME